MSDALDIFCRDSVDISRAYVELRKSMTGKSDVDHDGNDDESFNLPIEEIPDAMSPARDQVSYSSLVPLAARGLCYKITQQCGLLVSRSKLVYLPKGLDNILKIKPTSLQFKNVIYEFINHAAKGKPWFCLKR